MGWLGRYGNPDKPVKRTPIERLKLVGMPVFFLTCCAFATAWMWQNFIFNDPIQVKEIDLFSNTPQETLDKFKDINKKSEKQ